MKNCLLLIAAASSTAITIAQAGEIGHFNGGVLDIRDYFVPAEPGFYGLVYNYYYFTDRVNNRNGDKISSVDINTPSGPVTVERMVWVLVSASNSTPCL